MSEIIEPGTDLVVVETLNALTVFAPGGVEDVLARLEKQARAAATDASTPANRKHLTSLAYKVARSKTALDKLGKDLAADAYAQWKSVTAERAIIRDRLDALADEVRKPLTDWENKDKARIAAHEAALAAIPEGDAYWKSASPSADIRVRLEYLKNYPARDWEEFEYRFNYTIADEIARTTSFLMDTEAREAEAAELARLRVEDTERQRQEAARLQAEREARIAAEAAATAQAAAKAKADAAEIAARVERDRLAAEQRAERSRQDAIEAERRRVATEQATTAREAEKRAANLAHQRKIHRDILAALALLDLTEDQAKAVITAIARGDVPHVSITY